jgi:hypothetical protein
VSEGLEGLGVLRRGLEARQGKTSKRFHISKYMEV